MKIKNILRLTILLAIFVIINCGSTQPQVKEEPKPEPETSTKSTTEFNVNDVNIKLAKLTLEGFAYKGTQIKNEIYGSWVKNSVPVLKELLQKLPPGYILQISGHTDAKGPEEPTGNKEGNIALSEKRAVFVYNALKKYGIDDPAIKYRGLGSAELKDSNNPNSSVNRRVTFEVISDQ
ncbi:MAG: OmpA family protein [Spirochaetia bacterium]|nr:OmpA family protein [Spirochaetia bacterium]